MTSPQSTLKPKFIGWNKPAIELVAERLKRELVPESPEQEGDGAPFPTALCGTLLVVPTAESGRRLRELTAELVGRPVLMPRITVPGNMLPAEDAADGLQMAAAWTKAVSEKAASESGSALFPARPPEGHEEDWVSAQAAELQQLDHQLEQHGIEIGDITRALRQNPRYAAVAQGETSRWEQFAELTREVERQLADWGLRSPKAARLAALGNLAVGQIPERVILACIPQLPEQGKRYLDRLMQLGCRVEIWVNAPEDLAPCFDEYGQPRYDGGKDSWNSLPIPVPDTCIEVAAHSRDMAARTVRWVHERLKAKVEEVALGALDTSCLPDLGSAFADAGWKMLSPSARVALGSAAGLLPSRLRDAADSLAGADAKPAAALLRNPLMLRLYYPENRGWRRFCAGLDTIEQQKFPSRADILLQMIEEQCGGIPGAVPYARHVIGTLMPGIRSRRKMAGTLMQLGTDMQNCFTDPETPHDQLAANLAAALKEYAGIVPDGDSCLCSAHTALSIIETQTAGQSITGLSHEDANIDALGWLEMIYAPGKYMVLAGLHEGCVPEAPSVDAYLPDSLRQGLGMACSAQRRARDSFILAALANARGENLHILVAKERPDGTPATPSSLLLRSEDKLVERINHLFKYPESPVALPPFERGNWYVGEGCRRTDAADAPPAHEHISLIQKDAGNRWENPEEHFSPTLLKRFLACPLRFWLNELLRLNPGDAYQETTGALGARDLGVVVHETIEQFVKRYSGNECDYPKDPPDTAAMQRAILEEFDSRLRSELGEDLPLSMEHQRRTYERKLQDFAELHAGDLQAGWVVMETEKKFSWKLDDKYPLELRVDRMDENRLTGELRVVDYKTGKTPPEEAHLEGMDDADAARYMKLMPEVPLWKDADGGYARWKDLQLPLYKECLQRQSGGKPVRTGYFIISKGTEPVEFAEWDITGAQVESALDCARGAMALIRGGRGLYSAEELGFDPSFSDFGSLAAGGDLKAMLNLPDFTNNSQEQ